MKNLAFMAVFLTAIWAAPTAADRTEARCDIDPVGARGAELNVRSNCRLSALILGLTSAFEAPATDLSGTSWRLVKITSMDDSVYFPNDRSKYTLELQADGKASIRADCNRGVGTWTSESSGQLEFGPIAATRALCSPGSLFEIYLAQFEWVHSYVLEDGHLFLATMADGSIIEFEPAGTEPPVDIVLGAKNCAQPTLIGKYCADTRPRAGRAFKELGSSTKGPTL